MLKLMYKSDASYVSCRAGVYYYTRRVLYDMRQHYASKRLSFSLKTKSYAGAFILFRFIIAITASMELRQYIQVAVNMKI